MLQVDGVDPSKVFRPIVSLLLIADVVVVIFPLANCLGSDLARRSLKTLDVELHGGVK